MPTIVRFHQLGGPEGLKFDDVPQQQPGKGEARLRVRALGLNRAESMFYRGQYLEEPKFPSRLGYEAAGVVDAVGEGVDPAWIGKSVATVPAFSQGRYGTLGEEAVVPAFALAEYPKNLSPAQASAVLMQYLTAYGALVHYGKIAAGDFVSITAASSSVGLAAIQIARDAGATAIAVTRTSGKRKALLELGAHHVIVTQEEDYPARIGEITGGKGARLTFDPVAGPFVQKLAEGAAPGGVIFEYGALSGEPTPFPLFVALGRGLSIRGYVLMEISQNPALLETAKKYVFDRLADGRFVPRIARTFPFKEIVEAYRYLEANQQIGKIVVTVP
ncbi:MAG TPA: zinc-dependent alcohol dehydrogenase family protein [Terracidiphilus sp.]|jgi:NADPH:quinone reductase-like Zn-dependent oxidoreductase|nr:zinc-dependent alcohol dehydrogenase family protein [Terracidiphilus sp.]